MTLDYNQRSSFANTSVQKKKKIIINLVANPRSTLWLRACGYKNSDCLQNHQTSAPTHFTSLEVFEYRSMSELPYQPTIIIVVTWELYIDWGSGWWRWWPPSMRQIFKGDTCRPITLFLFLFFVAQQPTVCVCPFFLSFRLTVSELYSRVKEYLLVRTSPSICPWHRQVHWHIIRFTTGQWMIRRRY